MPNLISLTHPSLQILGKTQTGVYPISRFLVNPFLIKENCHNSRTSADADMKLGPVSKLDKRKKNPVKKVSQWLHVKNIVTSLSFFRFMANLELSRSRIPDAEPIKSIFSLKVTFYLRKLKTELKQIYNATLTLLLWVKILFLPKNANFWQKMLTSAKLKEPWY